MNIEMTPAIAAPMERPGGMTSKAAYADQMSHLLNSGDTRSAFDLVRRALEHFPSDLFFYSYFGYLISVVERKPAEGIRICEDTIATLRGSMSLDMDFFYPIFYLNLGRAYLRGNRKKAAIEAFREGLKYDRRNRDLLAEIGKMGRRESPVFPFLKRSNPVNQYLGKLRHTLRGGSPR